MIAESFSHYRIKRKLGAGGMGEVFLAEDTVLERPVALKILPQAFTQDEDRLRRFTQEARSVSRLNHPNIITLYEVGVENETHYIATEYIEGCTLRELMSEGPLELSRIIELALQINSALGAAHALKIVHRDIKPENVMVRPDGYVKVLDFGLAKLHQPENDPQAATIVTSQTEPGLILGTVNYMSPEQARGLSVDQRTDIWSVGVLLYEMSTGKLPFSGQTITDTIISIVSREPEPFQASFSNDAQASPRDLFTRLLMKALVKEPSGRYQTADEMSADLRLIKQQIDSGALGLTTPLNSFAASQVLSTQALPHTQNLSPQGYATQIITAQTNESTRPRSLLAQPFFLVGLLSVLTIAGFITWFIFVRQKARPNSIAVLPFVNEGTDQQNDYLGDGITENIINSLSQVAGLRVISRSSAFHYKGQSDFAKIGRELGVSEILTGRVRQDGDALSINTELIRVEDQSQIFGKKYVLKMANMSTVQDEIAMAITEKLRMKLSGEEMERMTGHYQPKPEAYEEYLKGRFYWNKRTASGLQNSIEYYNAAIVADPQFALPYAGLADTYALLSSYNALSPHNSMPLAKKNADSALALDDRLAEALTSRAFVKFYYEWDWIGAEDDFKRAIELKPSYANAHQWYADYLVVRGRPDEALQQARVAVTADPLSLAANGAVGLQYYFNNQPDQAIAQYQKTLELDKDFPPAILSLALAYQQKGQTAEAKRIVTDALPRLGENPPFQALLGYLQAKSGKETEARAILQNLLERQQAKREYISAYEIAIIYAGLGEREKMFSWLNLAAEEKSVYFVFLKTDPLFKEYRSDPGFASLLKTLRLN